jgi:hypothetical protein
MTIKTYQAYAKFLKDAVENEREECIVEKRLVLTAAAAIEELVNVVMEHESTLLSEKNPSDA